MTDLESLKSLQARIRLATGADRELDAEIFSAFHGGRVETMRNAWTSGPFWHVHIGARIVVDFPKFTTDPDGLGPCVGLLEAALPGARWFKHLNAAFEVYKPRADDDRGFCLVSRPLANDCLTFLDAIFSAKISELEARETVG